MTVAAAISLVSMSKYYPGPVKYKVLYYFYFLPLTLKSMLTREAIRKVVEEERSSNKLTKLPEDFFEQVKTYIDLKEKASKSKDDVWELSAAKRLISELLEKREEKLASLAVHSVRAGINPGSLTFEEQKLFDQMVSAVKEFQKSKQSVLEGKPEKRDAVAILKDIPEFVGPDMKNYGPYKEGDIVTIPKESAALLIEAGTAKKLVSD